MDESRRGDDWQATQPSSWDAPPGVDAHAWSAFETRIRARRRAALLIVIESALANGDTVTAQHAMLEARQLSDQAPLVEPLAKTALSNRAPAWRAADQLGGWGVVCEWRWWSELWLRLWPLTNRSEQSNA